MPYELKVEDGQTIECDCCGYPAPTNVFEVHTEETREVERRPMNFCEVCSSTLLSISVKYPRQCPDPSLYQAVGWIANKILDTLRDMQKQQ